MPVSDRYRRAGRYSSCRVAATPGGYADPDRVTLVGTLERLLRMHNRTMIGFDLALGSGALLKPAETLRVLGHDRPRAETEELFRRLGPVWLTFAVAHMAAELRDERRDWWALAWLRGTEIATDAIWARSPGFSRPVA